MGQLRCEIEGCERAVRARGWCGAHYERWRAHGDPNVDLRSKPTTYCSVFNCNRKAVGRGLCSKHYARFMRLGSTELPERRIMNCRADECDQPANGANGYCNKHYQRIRKYGDPSIDRRATGRGDCSMTDCNRTTIARGYCSLHYQRFIKHGNAEAVSPCRSCGDLNPAPNISWCLKCIEGMFRDGGFQMIGKFVDRMKGVECKCLSCGRTTSPCLMNVRKGAGCLECAKRETARRCRESRLTQEQATKTLATVGIRITSEYVNAAAPVHGECTRCHRPVTVMVGKIRSSLQGGQSVYGCRECAYAARTLSEDAVRSRCREAGSEYLGGFTTIRNRIRVRCLTCGRERSRKASDILVLGNGCRHCMPRAIYNSKKLLRDSELANLDAFLYIFQFTDDAGIVFRKYGVGRIETRGESRLAAHERNGGTLIDIRHADLLTVVTAEELIRKHVGNRSYTPRHRRLLQGGYTECYRAHLFIDLDHFIERATETVAQMKSEYP